MYLLKIYLKHVLKVKTCQSCFETIQELEEAINLLKTPRYGPCIIDIQLICGQKLITINSNHYLQKFILKKLVQYDIDEQKIIEIIAQLKRF